MTWVAHWEDATQVLKHEVREMMRRAMAQRPDGDPGCLTIARRLCEDQSALWGVMRIVGRETWWWRETEQMAALLPCPFCGFGQPQVDTPTGEEGVARAVWILCPGCGARTGEIRVSPVYDPDARSSAEREAWDEWQTRYTPEGERER